MEAEEVDVLGIDAVDHSLGVGEGILPIVVAAAVAETAVEDAPGRIEPENIDGDTLPTHTLHEGDVVMLVGILLMIPRAAAVTAKVQTVGRTWHHRAVAGQHLVAMNHLLYLGTLDEVIVQFTTIGLPRVSLIRSPSHVPVRRPSSMEKDAVTLGAHHPGHGAVVGAQDVLAAHGRTRPATQFDVQMDALPTQIHLVHAFAKAEEMFIGSQHTRSHGTIAFGRKPAVGFLVKHLSRHAVEHLDAPRAVADL